jgi:DNA polymerase III alpha subunit (gram-positive type)
MAQTYEELKKKTVAELRQIAKETDHEAVKGYTQLNKEHLLTALCKALNIELHQHHEVTGVDKTSIKKMIRVLKKKREQALADHDHVQLKRVRRQIHSLKRKIHKATV